MKYVLIVTALILVGCGYEPNNESVEWYVEEIDTIPCTLLFIESTDSICVGTWVYINQCGDTVYSANRYKDGGYFNNGVSMLGWIGPIDSIFHKEIANE